MIGRKVYNRCPVDHEPLVICELEGIEVDYCPKCGGVWLDRGELDLMATRTGGQAVEFELVSLSRSADPPSERKCPRCLRKMVEIETAGPQIEYCAHGDGYWLDGGELLELIQASGHPAANFLEEMFLSSLEKRKYDTDFET